MYAEDDQSLWDDHIPYVMMAYRASPHSSTGHTPNEMMFGRQVELPLMAMVAVPVDDVDERARCPEDWVEGIRGKMLRAHEVAREHLRKSAEYQK